MGAAWRVIEALGPHHEIVELGGVVHYSVEMLSYLRSLPKEQADRIVAEIAYQNRRRRIIRLRSDAPRWLRSSPELDRIPLFDSSSRP